jgi:hypothetical protein
VKGDSGEVFDVVIVGGGPAGMMAALFAAKKGKQVLLLEKNKNLGKKLLITGGGRCNITNNKSDMRSMLAEYRKNDKFLFSAFAQFGVSETVSFFQAHGLEVKEENEGRLFPVSNTAQSVCDVLVSGLQESGVTVRLGVAVSRIEKSLNGGHFIITYGRNKSVHADAVIIATGGTSRPETGSTGDGYAWMRTFGHTVKENDFALVPVSLSDSWISELSGISLSEVKMTIVQNGVRQGTERGKLLFTHVGVSGPMVLNASRNVGELLRYGEVLFEVDLFPSVDHGELRTRIQALFVSDSNKKIKNTLPTLLPKALALRLLLLAGIDPETPNHSVRSVERTKLVHIIKTFPLHVAGLLGKEKAVITAGGVVPEEVDFKTMQSRVVPGLFIIGDMLNIDRPSGGYSLQLCWTTGYVAGIHC